MPPTWVNGIGHSQRSAGSSPSATADPSADAKKLPCDSVIRFGADVVPEVCITASGWSLSSRPDIEGIPDGSPRASGPDTTTLAPARRIAFSSSVSRRSTGTAATS